jgi:WD40 repeat protein
VYSYLAISKDDSQLAFSNSEGKIEIWDVKTKTRYAVLDNYERPSWLTFTPDGKYLVFTTGSKNVIIWDLASRYIHGKIENKDYIYGIYVTSDSKSMILYFKNEVSIWSIEDLKKYHTFDLFGCDRIQDVAVTPDSKYIAIAASVTSNIFDGIVIVFDTSTRKLMLYYNTVVE